MNKFSFVKARCVRGTLQRIYKHKETGIIRKSITKLVDDLPIGGTTVNYYFHENDKQAYESHYAALKAANSLELIK